MTTSKTTSALLYSAKGGSVHHFGFVAEVSQQSTRHQHQAISLCLVFIPMLLLYRMICSCIHINMESFGLDFLPLVIIYIRIFFI